MCGARGWELPRWAGSGSGRLGSDAALTQRRTALRSSGAFRVRRLFSSPCRGRPPSSAARAVPWVPDTPSLPRRQGLGVGFCCFVLIDTLLLQLLKFLLEFLL